MRKNRKKSPAKKRKVSKKRSVSVMAPKKRKKRVSTMKKMKKRSKKSHSTSTSKNPKAILENVLIGTGSFVASFVISKFIENKLLKVGASAVPVALSYFGMPKYILPVSVGSGISALMLAFQGYASQELKSQVTEWTGLTLGMDGDVILPEETARLLLGAYRKALSGDSNGSPLSGDTSGMPLSGKSEYVVSGSQYVISGARSTTPLS